MNIRTLLPLLSHLLFGGLLGAALLHAPASAQDRFDDPALGVMITLDKTVEGMDIDPRATFDPGRMLVEGKLNPQMALTLWTNKTTGVDQFVQDVRLYAALVRGPEILTQRATEPVQLEAGSYIVSDAEGEVFALSLQSSSGLRSTVQQGPGMVKFESGLFEEAPDEFREARSVTASAPRELPIAQNTALESETEIVEITQEDGRLDPDAWAEFAPKTGLEDDEYGLVLYGLVAPRRDAQTITVLPLEVVLDTVRRP